MPGMNGLQLQSQLAAADCRIPIIFITLTTTTNPVGAQCKPALSRFWQKPFSDEQLLQWIRSALRQEKAGME